MKRVVHVWWAILIAATTWAAGEGGSAPLREANSANGRFQLQIRPGRPGDSAIRGCKAGLYERSGERARSRPRWERFLVNDIAPGRAFVRDDGRFVVTLDEHTYGGARNALVIYGEHGELLRHFLLSDLLDRSGWTDVKKRGQSLNWLEGAGFQFLDTPPTFLITLRQGREIGIDLQKLEVVRQSGAISGIAAVPSDFLGLLFKFAAGAAPDKADAGGQSEQQVESAAADELAAGDERDADNEVAEQAQLIAELERPVDPADVGAADDQASQSEEEMPVESEAGGDPLASETKPAVMAENLPAEAGYGDVPQPDPAAPVDYVAWANSLIATDGPSAVPEYQAAVNRLARWEGASDLLKAAQAGDPAALASPEIQAWLAGNQAALRHFRNGLALEYNGWPLASEDGSLIMCTLPALQAMRELSGATIVQGRQYAAAGLPGSAAESYFDALAAGAHAGSGATLIESLVGAAIQRPAAEAILDLEAGPAGEQLDYTALAARLEEQYQLPRPLTETLQFERASFLDAVQRLYTYDGESGEYSLDLAKAADFLKLVSSASDAEADKIAAGVGRLAEIGFEQTVTDGNGYYDSLSEAFTRPYSEAQQMLESAERLFDEGRANPLLTVPSYYRYHQVRAKADAMQRATRLVTQLNAYRQAHGDYPESLDVFGGADFAIDPFTGKALNYQPTGGTFRLYSVGVNGADDGGVNDPSGSTGDIVYWPRPKPQQPAGH
jgi:hypothetical protein